MILYDEMSLPGSYGVSVILYDEMSYLVRMECQ